MTRRISFRDVEQLSTYLDQELSSADTVRLESRVASNPELAAMLEILCQSRNILRGVPHRRAPRNFTLTPQTAGLRAPTPRAVPILRFATVLATILLVITFSANSLLPRAARLLAAMPMGIGGGAPQAVSVAEEIMITQEAPVADESMATQAEPPAEAPPPAEPTAAPAMAAPTSTPQEAERNFAVEATESIPEAELAKAPTPEPETGRKPVFALWQTGLFIVAVLSGLVALSLYWNNQLAFRRKYKKPK